MEQMFYSADAFNQPLSRWDVSSVTNMAYMFYDADAFNEDIGAWDTSSVTTMEQMFYSADAFNQPLSRWDVSSVTNMRYMFYDADMFYRWDTSSVTTMEQMFYNADAFNQPLSRWDVSSVTTMGTCSEMPTRSMKISVHGTRRASRPWSRCSIQSRYIFMEQMHRHARLFEASTRSISHDHGADYSRWDVSSVTNMRHMFYDADAFNKDILGWDTFKVTDSYCIFCSADAWHARFEGSRVDAQGRRVRRVPSARQRRRRQLHRHPRERHVLRPRVQHRLRAEGRDDVY